jgi:hypothetical protein
MQKKIISDKYYFEKLLSKIKKDSYENLYLIADFDCTITHFFTEN